MCTVGERKITQIKRMALDCHRINLTSYDLNLTE